MHRGSQDQIQSTALADAVNNRVIGQGNVSSLDSTLRDRTTQSIPAGRKCSTSDRTGMSRVGFHFFFMSSDLDILFIFVRRQWIPDHRCPRRNRRRIPYERTGKVRTQSGNRALQAGDHSVTERRGLICPVVGSFGSSFRTDMIC